MGGEGVELRLGRLADAGAEGEISAEAAVIRKNLERIDIELNDEEDDDLTLSHGFPSDQQAMRRAARTNALLYAALLFSCAALAVTTVLWVGAGGWRMASRGLNQASGLPLEDEVHIVDLRPDDELMNLKEVVGPPSDALTHHTPSQPRVSLAQVRDDIEELGFNPTYTLSTTIGPGSELESGGTLIELEEVRDDIKVRPI